MSPHRDGFYSDGGTDVFDTALDLAKQLKEECSTLRCPTTNRFHVIRKYDVQRRITELKWLLYATVEVHVAVRYHVESTRV